VRIDATSHLKIFNMETTVLIICYIIMFIAGFVAGFDYAKNKYNKSK
jgi:hypothetical protein